jgi:hypothetical protein
VIPGRLLETDGKEFLLPGHPFDKEEVLLHGEDISVGMSIPFWDAYRNRMEHLPITKIRRDEGYTYATVQFGWFNKEICSENNVWSVFKDKQKDET